MKRDMDFVRDLLLRIEGGETHFETIRADVAAEIGAETPPASDDPEKLREHLHLIEQAGLIEVQFSTMDGGIDLRGLTWEGHDFLDTVRDPEVWKRTKEGASKMGGWTFGLIKDLGTAYLKHAAKERLGLDL